MWKLKPQIQLIVGLSLIALAMGLLIVGLIGLINGNSVLNLIGMIAGGICAILGLFLALSARSKIEIK